jgi:uncharacterized protein with NRDE domain
MVFGLDPEVPLVVAANRDERLDRSSTPMTVLSPDHPRILGGRDNEAGGTWLAVNSHGLVAGLTNRPVLGGRDPAKRTRGELPLALASHRGAPEAVDDFLQRFSPADYNPAWFLVGDRRSLFAIDLSDGDRPTALCLEPGLHILENAPLGAPSRKVDQVRSLLGPPSELVGPSALEKLRTVLADHTTRDHPTTGGPRPSGQPTTHSAHSGSVTPGARRPETLAACVHTDDYGTRSSTIISVPRNENVPPRIFFAEGHPCTSDFLEATALWTSGNQATSAP